MKTHRGRGPSSTPFTSVYSPSIAVGAASPPGDDDDDSSDVHRRKRHRGPTGSRPHSLSLEGGGRGAVEPVAGDGSLRRRPVFERLGAQPGSSGHVMMGSSPVSQGCISGAHNFQEEGAAGADEPTSPATVIDNIPDQDPALKKGWVRRNERLWDKSTPDKEARSAVLHCKGTEEDPSIVSPTLTCFINEDAFSEKVQPHTPAEKLSEESIDSLANKARTQRGGGGGV
jgi:hypothetical protein